MATTHKLMWHEARQQEKFVQKCLVDYQKRAERRKEYYEKIKQDPTQFIQIHGRNIRVHVDPAIYMAAEGPGTMLPWHGDTACMIDRFDGRAHLEEIPARPVCKDPDSPSVAPQDWEERQCNYERYRILVQNDFLNIGEEKFLQQIRLEELYGPVSNKATEEEKKILAPKKAAIGFTYGDDLPSAGAPPPLTAATPATAAGEADKNSDDDSDSDIDLDMTVDVMQLTNHQQQQLNTAGTVYGMQTEDFMDLISRDLQEAEELRLVKQHLDEKAMLSGRKSRKERRALKKKILEKKNSPPSYAARSSPTYQPYRRGSTHSSSRSPSTTPPPSSSTGQIKFITSFGGDSDVGSDKEEGVTGVIILPKESGSSSHRRSESRGGDVRKKNRWDQTTSDVARDRDGGRNRPRDWDRDRGRVRDGGRDRDRYSRRSRSRERVWRRDNRDRYSRGRPDVGRSRSPSYRGTGDHHRQLPQSRSRSGSRSSRRRSRSPSRDKFPQKRYHHRSSSLSPKRTTAAPPANKINTGPFPTLPSPSGEGFAISAPPPLPPPPTRRYYGRRGQNSDTEDDDEDEKESGGAKSSVGKAEDTVPSVPKHPAGVARSAGAGGVGGGGVGEASALKVSSSTSVAAGSKKELMRKKMQALLKRQYKADKLKEREQLEKQAQERMDRDEELREMAIKMRRREREKRHRQRDSDSDSSRSRSRSLSSTSPHSRRSQSPYGSSRLSSRGHRGSEKPRRSDSRSPPIRRPPDDRPPPRPGLLPSPDLPPRLLPDSVAHSRYNSSPPRSSHSMCPTPPGCSRDFHHDSSDSKDYRVSGYSGDDGGEYREPYGARVDNFWRDDSRVRPFQSVEMDLNPQAGGGRRRDYNHQSLPPRGPPPPLPSSHGGPPDFRSGPPPLMGSRPPPLLPEYEMERIYAGGRGYSRCESGYNRTGYQRQRSDRENGNRSSDRDGSSGDYFRGHQDHSDLSTRSNRSYRGDLEHREVPRGRTLCEGNAKSRPNDLSSSSTGKVKLVDY